MIGCVTANSTQKNSQHVNSSLSQTFTGAGFVTECIITLFTIIVNISKEYAMNTKPLPAATGNGLNRYYTTDAV